jgi:hypothetical protein
MLKHIIKSLNKSYNKNNLFKRSLCNLALDDKYFQYYNDSNDENLFIDKINYDTKKRYLTITKQPYYLDEDYIKENYVKENYFEKLKKMNMICESSGSKCLNCNGSGYILNKKLKYDLCGLCNGNGIY